MSTALHFQPDALHGVTAGIAVVEIEGREHDGRGRGVHERVGDVNGRGHVVRTQVEVDDAVR